MLVFHKPQNLLKPLAIWLLGASIFFSSSPVFSSSFLLKKRKSKEVYEYKVKTNFFDASNVHLLAVDSLGVELKSWNGVHPVEINGFEYPLFFLLGHSQIPGKLKKSAFITLKPVSDRRTQPSFYLLFRWGEGIYPQYVSGFWMIGIPIGILILLYFFRKLIIWVEIILVVMVIYFHPSNPWVFIKELWEWALFHLHIHF